MHIQSNKTDPIVFLFYVEKCSEKLEIALSYRQISNHEVRRLNFSSFDYVSMQIVKRGELGQVKPKLIYLFLRKFCVVEFLRELVQRHLR